MFNTFSSFRDKQKADSIALTQLETDFAAFKEVQHQSSAGLVQVQQDWHKSMLLADKKIKSFGTLMQQQRADLTAATDNAVLRLEAELSDLRQLQTKSVENMQLVANKGYEELHNYIINQIKDVKHV